MRKQRTTLDRAYLEKQACLYEKSLSLDRKHDLLYRMGTNADVLNSQDIFAISGNGGRLTKEQRQRVIKLMARELNIELANWDDLPPKIFCLMPDGIKPLYHNSDLEDGNSETSKRNLDDLSVTKLENDVVCLGWESSHLSDFVRVLVDAGISLAQAVEVAPLLDKYPRSPLEKEVVTQVWEQLCKLNLQ